MLGPSSAALPPKPTEAIAANSFGKNGAHVNIALMFVIGMDDFFGRMFVGIGSEILHDQFRSPRRPPVSTGTTIVPVLTGGLRGDRN